MSRSGHAKGKGRMLRPGPALALASVTCVAACGADTSAERQMDRLNDEIRRVQTERDQLDKRLAALGPEDRAGASGGLEARSDAAAQVETPELRVVRLRPPGDEGPRAPEDGATADDPAPRPTVRATGSGRSSRRKSGSEAIVEGDDAPAPVDAPAESAGPTPARPSNPGSGSGQGAAVLDPQAKKAYDHALALVHKRRFDDALEAFAGFLVRWPDHPYADNAFYWRGECFFAKGQYDRASEQFEATIHRFPFGNKAPDALLKLGMSQERLGQRPAARDTYERLARDYPRSEAAKRIPKEGRR